MTTLTTERLTLRPVRRDDMDALRVHWDQPEVRRFLFDDRPVARDAVEGLVDDSLRDFAEHGYGLWAMLDGDALVGVCGLRPADDGLIEILYSLDLGRWGEGLATEAARAVLDHAARVGATQVIAETGDGDHASERVAERLGMTRTGVRQGRAGPLRRFAATLR